MIKKLVWNYLERVLSKIEREVKAFEKTHKRSREFRVLTYQFEFRYFDTPEVFVEFLRIRREELKKFSPRIVSLPRFFVNSLFGLVPLSRNKLKTQRGFSLFDTYSSLIKNAFSRILTEFSRATGSVVLGGTLKTSEREEGLLVKPNGKISFLRREDLFGRVFEVDGVRCAFLFPSETLDHRAVRTLSEKGVRVFFTTEVLKGDYDEWRMKRGIWARSQSIGIFGVNASTNGMFMGEKYSGISFISAPAILTKNLDGYVAKLGSSTGNGMVVADLDLESLESFIDSLPKTYRKYRSFV